MTDKELFIMSRWAYSVGKPIIDDAHYNKLREMFEATDRDWEYVNRTWSNDPCPVDLLKREGRTDLIEAVVIADKTESVPSLNNLYDVQTKYELYDYGTDSFVSYKHDGWNVQLTYYDGELIDLRTRGRSTDNAINVEAIRSILPSKIPLNGRVRVIGECTCSSELFVAMKQIFGSASERSAVRTALTNPSFAVRLSFHAFNIISDDIHDNIFPTLISWGFKVPRWQPVSSYKELINLIQAMGDEVSKYPYPTDGLVMRKGSEMYAIRIGAWEEPIHESYVMGYEQSYGAHIISMKVAIYPKHTGKGVQRRLSVTNCKRIIENNLRVGYPIAFKFTSASYGDIDEEATRMLQNQWAGREHMFRFKIEQEEAIYDNLVKSGELRQLPDTDVRE